MEKKLRGSLKTPLDRIRLKAGNYKALCKRSLKKIVVIGMMLVPGPLNGYHEMKHNSAANHSSESIGILESEGKTRFLITL